MDFVFLKVKYDPLLVSPEFMAEQVYELDGIAWVEIEDAN